MLIRRVAISLAVCGLCACNQAAENATANNQSTTVVNEAPEGTESGPNVGLPDDRTPLDEPNGPIDPKSPEAAGQIVQRYAALIEQGRWTESWKLWSSVDDAKQFDRNRRDDAEVHVEIGKPGDLEGAAGSIYVSEPVVFYGKTKAGGSFRRSATVTLRRVNDVPGSSEEQRRWHIERIDLNN